MRIVLILLLMVLLPLAGNAQSNLFPRKKQSDTPMSEAQKKTLRDEEKAYKSALDKMPDQKKFDPWAKVRQQR